MNITINIPWPPPPAPVLRSQRRMTTVQSRHTIGPDQTFFLNDFGPSETSLVSNSRNRDGRPEDVESAPSMSVSTVALVDKGTQTSSEKVDQTEASEPADAVEIVDFDGPDDPSIPINWPSSTKLTTLAILSLLTMVTPLASSMIAPGVPQIMEEFGSTDPIVESIIVSVYVLGYAFGPIIIAPMSELYGRLPVYHITNILFIIFTIACGGIAGSAAITMGGGSCADMFVSEQRGRAISIWSIGPLIGPVIGPICGGFLCQAKGWRWVFWVICIAMAFIVIPMAIVFRESYAPVILDKKARRLRKVTGNLALRSKLDNGLSPGKAVLQALVRPTKLLFLAPIVTMLATYTAICYGYVYLLLTTFTLVFEQEYDFPRNLVGLSFLGLGIGMLLGLGVFYILSDRIMKQRAAAIGGELKPESRLVLVFPGAVLVPIGFFIYGWTAQFNVHWMVPIIGTAILGIGLMGASLPIQAYVVDAYPLYAASAIAAIAILRSIVGALLPLAGLPMYQRMGLGWGNTLLGFIAILLIPVTVLLLKFGEQIRTNPKFQPSL